MCVWVGGDRRVDGVGQGKEHSLVLVQWLALMSLPVLCVLALS